MAETEEPMEVDVPKGKENVKKLTRGEKSKVAAKSRRDKEHEAMLQLMKELPIKDELLNKMDKAAVVKLATCYLKIKHFVQKDITVYGHKALTNGNTPKETAVETLQVQSHNNDDITEDREGQLMLEALNGFLIFVNRKGSIKFVSKTIEDHLGLKQEYLFGKNVYDYIHEGDHKELSKQFTEDKRADKPNTSPYEEEPQRVFYVRMKFNLQKPGSKAKHTGDMLVQWSGKMKRHLSMKHGTMVTDGLLCICRTMQTTPLLEIRMDGNMFMSRHDLGMTFTFCDTRIITLIGYEPNEVVGKTAYHFHNPIDAPKVGDCHQKLMMKGNSVSKYYRFLGKADNWVWLQTRATIIYNTANKPQYIVCMNYVISEEEGERYLMLEEHQHANQHTENTVLTLHDNHPFTIVSTCPTSSLKIVELEEENLEKTACFNGELDKKQPTEDSITTRTQQSKVVNGYQQNCAGTDPSLVSPNGNASASQASGVAVGNCSMTMVSQEISQPALADVPDLSTASSSSAMEDESNKAIIDPQSQDYAQVCSPEGSNGTYASSLCLPHANDQYNCGMVDQNMAPSSSSSHSEDAGYESATSPYNGSYFSPQMVSPVCNYDSSSDRGYAQDLNNPRGLIQGQNCSLGVGYGPAVSMSQNGGDHLLQGDHPMDVLADTNNEYSNPVLDEILQSLNQSTSDNLDVNMALVYSSIESLASKSPSTVCTSMTSPVSKSSEKPAAKTPSNSKQISQRKQSDKRTDSSLLRSFLTMPQEAIPSQPPGGFLQMRNKKDEKSAFARDNNPVERQGTNSAQIQNHSNQTCRNMNVNSNRSSDTGPISDCENGQYENMDNNDGLDIDEIPEYALQYLVNDFTDAQAQALIADLQGEGGLQNDSFMDTSDSDFTKDFVSSLESQSLSTRLGGENVNFSSYNGSQAGSNIPFSQCKTSSYSLGTGTKCNTDQRQNTMSGLNGSSMSLSNYRSGISGHDHVYHQSVSRLNGQNRPRFHKSPENPGVCTRFNGVQSTCHSQTQTSEHCMSELERHLRNKLTSRGMSCSSAQSQCIMNSDKPFLQQLLTGELTNDMYMKMERKRFESKNVIPK